MNHEYGVKLATHWLYIYKWCSVVDVVSMGGGGQLDWWYRIRHNHV